MANLIYQNSEATIWFVPAGATQAETVVFEIDGLGADAGHQSAHWDRTVAAIPEVYHWRAFVQFATDPVEGDVVEVYLKTSGDSVSATAHPDNDDGTGDLGVSEISKLKNLHFLGSIVVDEGTAANTEMVASGFVRIAARGINVVFWNNVADALTTDENESGFSLTPVPLEIQ